MKKMRGAGLVLAALAVVALSACGSSKSTASPAAQPTSGSTSAPSTGAGATATVMTTSNGSLGTIMVDAAGKTLYTLTDASGKPVACTGQCLTFWPPLLLTGGTTAPTAASGVTGLGTVSAAGGTQVTAAGAPLYHFSGDAAAGDANGEGVKSFGGTWHVVKASGGGSVVAPSPTTGAPAATTPTTSGYGY